MNTEELREAVKPFLERIVEKETGNGILYSPQPPIGLSRQLKLVNLGYFKSEKEALEAFYNYLKANKRI